MKALGEPFGGRDNTQDTSCGNQLNVVKVEGQK